MYQVVVLDEVNVDQNWLLIVTAHLKDVTLFRQILFTLTNVHLIIAKTRMLASFINGPNDVII